MIYKVIEFKIREDQVEEAKKVIKEFAIKVGSESRTLAFDSYLRDGSSFMLFMTFDSPEAEEFHTSTTYIKEFRTKLVPMCEIEPKATTLTKF